jgi:hypothetical protein
MIGPPNDDDPFDLDAFPIARSLRQVMGLTAGGAAAAPSGDAAYLRVSRAIVIPDVNGTAQIRSMNMNPLSNTAGGITPKFKLADGRIFARQHNSNVGTSVDIGSGQDRHFMPEALAAARWITRTPAAGDCPMSYLNAAFGLAGNPVSGFMPPPTAATQNSIMFVFVGAAVKLYTVSSTPTLVITDLFTAIADTMYIWEITGTGVNAFAYRVRTLAAVVAEGAVTITPMATNQLGPTGYFTTTNNGNAAHWWFHSYQCLSDPAV